MSDRSLIKAELQNLQKILEAKAEMCIGAGKIKMLSFANACSGALELLKEREPRVMQISEIMEIYKADPSHVWPYNTPPYLYIQEHPHVRNSSESWAAWREIKDIIEGELFGHTAQSYGKTWRCWTARPTDEQREAVKWDADISR